MSKKNRNKKPKLAITAEGWSWLARNTGNDWQRILDLRGISIEAVFQFVKSAMSAESYAAFEELNLPAEVVTARRKAEAARIKAEELEKLSITPGTPLTEKQLHDDIITGRHGRFKPLGQLEWEQKQAAEKAKADGEELYIIPEAEF